MNNTKNNEIILVVQATNYFNMLKNINSWKMVYGINGSFDVHDYFEVTFEIQYEFRNTIEHKNFLLHFFKTLENLLDINQFLGLQYITSPNNSTFIKFIVKCENTINMLKTCFPMNIFDKHMNIYSVNYYENLKSIVLPFQKNINIDECHIGIYNDIVIHYIEFNHRIRYMKEYYDIFNNISKDYNSNKLKKIKR
tara:strand:+ start:2057 stop:2641 length:585 start_codon:yes stop_codon:yes gene_type:complete